MGKINRLRSVKLDEISFVGKGDNPEAHILLLKIKKDPTEASIVKVGKEYKGEESDTVLEKWLNDNSGLVKKEDDCALTFADIQNDKELREKVWSYCWTLEDSLGSIIRDENVTDKTAMITQSIDQFKAAITAITKGETGMSVELKKAQDALAASEAKVAELTKTVEDVTKENETLKACAADDKKKLDEAEAKMKKDADEDPIYKGLPEAVVKKMKDDSARIEKMEDENLTREFVAKAAEVPLVAKADEVGSLLKTIAKTDPATADKVLGMLKAANTRIAEGDLLKEKGDNTNTGAATAYDKIVAKAAELRKECPNLSEAQAFTKVYDSDADLRSEYLKETR